MDPGLFVGLVYAGATIMAGLAVIGAGIGLGVAGNGLVLGIARQPEQQGNMRTMFFIVMALVEGLAIIIIALAFVFPFIAQGAYNTYVDPIRLLQSINIDTLSDKQLESLKTVIQAILEKAVQK